MLEVEVQKLTAAIEALTKALLNDRKLLETLVDVENIQRGDQSYREDDAAREAMQAERLAKLDKIEKEQAEHAKTMDEVYGQTLAEKKQAEDDALAAVYKAEQAKAKRKARVTTEETKALVEAAVEENPKSPEPEKIAANISANITEADLKAMAMEIARADSSARPIILGILGEHGAKTITQLDAKHYHAVHGKFLSLANDIAKDGVPF